MSAIEFGVNGLEKFGKQVASYVQFGRDKNDSDDIVRIFAARNQDSDFSESSGHLRAILIGLKVSNDLGCVVILGSGEGGWPMVLAKEDFTSEWIHSFLWWKNHERPGLAFHHSRVTVKTQDIGSAQPYRCDTLLCNMQPGSVKLELANLKVLEAWLDFKPKTFAIRVIHYKDKGVIRRLEELQKQLKSGRLIGIVASDHGPIEAVYFVQGSDNHSIRKDSGYLATKIKAISDLGQQRPRLNGRWPIPEDLPDGVEQLAPLDMGATLKPYIMDSHEPFHPPKGGRNFMKELGWKEMKDYRNSNKFYKSGTLEGLIKPLEPLIENCNKWILTSSDPDTIDQTIREKIDHAPQENHKHHEYLWTTYKAVAMYLRDQKMRDQRACRVYRFSDVELEEDVNKQSSIGWQDRDLVCSNMGEYLMKPNIRKENVEEFKKNLLAGRPIKADYNSSGKREPKKENKSRLVWSLCATGRLYEAQVLGSADNLLKHLPYSTKGSWPQDYGEVFVKMLDDHVNPRHAICDDIKGWDTKVSYSMLCMEAAFLQLLSDDEEHRNEIKHLYRLYAYAVVNVIEAYWDSRYNEKKFRRVFYQLQGQVASGRRVTYTMNTITNIVVTMSRAAWSQGVKLDKLGEWVKRRLTGTWHSDDYGGKISGDDTVIVLGKTQARCFAQQGAKFMNDLGMIRKKTGRDKSQVDVSIYDLEFCSRKFVDVPMYSEGVKQLTRLIPIRRTDEVLMRRILKEDNRTHEYDLAWAREQGKELLVEYFHVPTLKLVALALLSVTPNNIVLDGEDILGWRETEKPITEEDIIGEINEKYFGTKTSIKSNYRVRSLKDLGSIKVPDRKHYDLDYKPSLYKDWESTLYDRVCKLRDPNKPYDDWLERPSGQSNIQKIFFCLFIFVLCALLLIHVLSPNPRV